jgi:hypothetical protein
MTSIGSFDLARYTDQVRQATEPPAGPAPEVGSAEATQGVAVAQAQGAESVDHPPSASDGVDLPPPSSLIWDPQGLVGDLPSGAPTSTIDG